MMAYQTRQFPIADLERSLGGPSITRRARCSIEPLAVYIDRSCYTIAGHEAWQVMPPGDVLGRMADQLRVAGEDLFDMDVQGVA